jgi:hypothetical protein
MKNMRNIVAAIVMVTILSVSTTFADGVVVGGKSGVVVGGKTQTGCSETKFGVVSTITGIIIGGFTGIIIGGRDGIIIGGRSSCDQSRDGLIISD